VPGNDLINGSAEGLQAPQITAFNSATGASGTAEPDATVRLFPKASDAEGELSSQFGSATADPSGNWTITFSAQPEGQRLVATQTVPVSVAPSLLQTSETSPMVQIDLPVSTPPQQPPVTTPPAAPPKKKKCKKGFVKKKVKGKKKCVKKKKRK
jgi:VCBS repeat-containing protein